MTVDHHRTTIRKVDGNQAFAYTVAYEYNHYVILVFVDLSSTFLVIRMANSRLCLQ